MGMEYFNNNIAYILSSMEWNKESLVFQNNYNSQFNFLFDNNGDSQSLLGMIEPALEIYLAPNLFRPS